MDTPVPRRSLTASLFYRDPWKGLDFLERAFGFERTMVLSDREGKLVHSELRIGDSTLMLGTEWAEFIASPASVGGKNTQAMHVQLPAGLDEHCERARAAGAVIVQPPTEQFYGDRTYRARDPEGHLWTFAQHVRDVSQAEAEQATGLKIDGWS
jgi:uncharacterized glyoxalase superfamily protein PhnB